MTHLHLAKMEILLAEIDRRLNVLEQKVDSLDIESFIRDSKIDQLEAFVKELESDKS